MCIRDSKGTGQSNDSTSCGGGGGAGGAGGDGTADSTGGDGGPGSSNVYAYGSTNPVTYAGGGGGGATAGGGAGGPGGGGAAGATAGQAGSNATFGTGGGGGGASHNAGTTPTTGGSGGSGILVVRYPIGQITANAKATGGAISFFGGKTIHTFTSSGTFANPTALNGGSPNPLNVEYVVVAGGGSGAASGAAGGGGGAGGYLNSTTTITSGSSFSVQIGAGGASPAPQTGYHGPPGGNPGDNSVVAFPAGTITSYGGGAGSGGNYVGDAGGSGGGGNGGYGTNGGPSPYTPQQGYGGGAGSGNPEYPPEKYGAGGGGGAGGAGQDAQISDSLNFAGSGGLGVQLPSTFQDPTSRVGQSGPGSTNYWVAGGGSGGTFNNDSGPGTAKGGTGPVPTASTDGPFAGGGNGSNSPGVDGTSGDENLSLIHISEPTRPY